MMLVFLEVSVAQLRQISRGINGGRRRAIKVEEGSSSTKIERGLYREAAVRDTDCCSRLNFVVKSRDSFNAYGYLDVLHLCTHGAAF
jgi:hypothetical protein